MYTGKLKAPKNRSANAILTTRNKYFLRIFLFLAKIVMVSKFPMTTKINVSVSNCQKKTSEKTMKYAPLRWELKQKYSGYEISQYNITVDVLGGWSTDVDLIQCLICLNNYT